MKELSVKLVNKGGMPLPEYKSEGAAAADLYAAIDEPVLLKPMQRVALGTGLFMELPSGYEAQIRSRSGLALKNGIICLNSPGTIDSDYRGEIKVILANMSNEDFSVERGMRIAQILVSPVLRADFIEVDSLSSTERGSGGFGHSGV